MKFRASNNLQKLPPYLFVDLDRKEKEALKKGIDIISFGIGDPDLPTPRHIVEAGQKALAVPGNQKYPFGPGSMEFREAVAAWYNKRFSVSLDPRSEIHVLIGSKEGIGHITLGFINPGDIVLVPEPGYPVYHAGTIIAGGISHFLPLKEENGNLPDLNVIPHDIAHKARIMFLNYPNNPTTAVSTEKFFKKVVSFAKKYQIAVVHDAAYSELYYDTPPISFLSGAGAKDVGVEFHSLSKTYSMTGWRIGWVCGNADIVNIVRAVKDNYDSGVFNAIQVAGIAALNGSQDCVAHMRQIYKKRRDILCKGLTECGWDVKVPHATFYVWAKTPENVTSKQCSEKLLDEAGIVCTPGSGMGPSGEGYVRFSLTVQDNRIIQAVERIGRLKW